MRAPPWRSLGRQHAQSSAPLRVKGGAAICAGRTREDALLRISADLMRLSVGALAAVFPGVKVVQW